MKDFIGRNLSEGDWVVYISHSKTSSHFCRSKIKYLTPKMVVMTDGTRKVPGKVLKISKERT